MYSVQKLNKLILYYFNTYFLFCIIFFLFKWLCWMVTSLKAVDLERITCIYIYSSQYARMNRCYNERGSRTNYVHFSITHCTPKVSFSNNKLQTFLTDKWLPVFQVKQRDCSQGDHSLGTQRGQFSVPHFCIVGGVGRPASSHRLLSTFCVVLCRRTMQCAALT